MASLLLIIINRQFIIQVSHLFWSFVKPYFGLKVDNLRPLARLMICSARVNHLSYRNMKILSMIWWTPFEIFDFFLIIWFRKNCLISCFYRLYIKLMPLILFNLGWQYWIYLWKWLRNAILMNELFTIIFSNLKNWGEKRTNKEWMFEKTVPTF